MRVIAVVSQKGGAGKSTVAVGLAVEAERAGRTAAVVDLDPQASASLWGDLREADTPAVTAAPAARLAVVLEAARDSGASLVAIDTSASTSPAVLSAAKAADLVVIPCRPALADLHAISESVDVARLACKPAVAVVNQALVGHPLTGQAHTAITNYGIQAAPVTLHARVDHVHAWAAGLAATEYAPAGKAAAELAALAEWIHGITKA